MKDMPNSFHDGTKLTVSTYPAVTALINLLARMEFFDHKISDDSVWLSGTIDGQPMNVQLNIADARAKWDKEFYRDERR